MTLYPTNRCREIPIATRLFRVDEISVQGVYRVFSNSVEVPENPNLKPSNDASRNFSNLVTSIPSIQLHVGDDY